MNKRAKRILWFIVVYVAQVLLLTFIDFLWNSFIDDEFDYSIINNLFMAFIFTLMLVFSDKPLFRKTFAKKPKKKDIAKF